MRTSVDQIGKNKVRLAVEVPAEEIAPYLDRTYRKLAGEIRVPGFRPGKAPKPVIDQRLGKDFVRSEALKDALPELLAEAVKTEDLDIVAPPEVDVKTFEEGRDLEFEAVLETRPEAVLQDYSGLAVSKPASGVGEKEVDEQIERLRVRYSSLEVVPRPAREGDFALIDLKTYRHDETIDEATAKDLLIEVGANMIVPELDAELTGKRTGDILKITTTLPEQFGEHAGWQVAMQVIVKEVKARKLPDLDDELAKTVSEFDTLDELRADLRTRLEEIKKVQADAAVRERTIDAFIKDGVDIDIPDGMVEMEIDRLIANMARMLAAQGATLQQYVEHEKIDYESLRQRMREQAEKNLTVRLGLDAVAKAEAVEITDEDRDKELEQLVRGSGKPADEIRQMLDEGENWSSVEGDILRAKALDLLVERAQITEETQA